VTAERALNEDAEQLRFVVNAVPALIAYLDQDARYVWANEAYRRWLGHPPDEIPGRHVSEVLGAAAWASVRPYVQRALAGEEVTFDYQLVHDSGLPRDRRVTYVPHRDAGGMVRGFVVLSHDLTEIRTTERALRRSEHMLEHSQSTAHVGSWELTFPQGGGPPDPDSLRWSDEAYRIFGHEPGAVATTPSFFFECIHPEDREAVRAASRRGAERGEPFEKEYRILRPDGTVRVVHAWSRFEREGGHAVRMLGTCQDITERKAAELEIQRAQEDLREADRRKDEFLAMLCHELRNPLAPILTAVQVLDRTGPGHEKMASKYRAVIARQVQHMKRLLDDLLDVARVSQGKIELRRETLELGALLLQAVEVSRPRIAEKRHELSMKLPPVPLPLDADPTRLVQVFANLLNNAAKYTDAGGHIALHVTTEDGEAVIAVRDDGVGMRPELVPRAFDLFVQETRSLDRSQGGLGIGLTMVRILVKMHGGSVRAFSDGPGRGSTFVVRLPLVPASPRSVARDALPAALAPRRPLRVLVVDDNEDAAKAMGHLLEMQGHHVTLAFDGPGALSAAAAQLPELVLLDIGLPGMDGYAVAALLRAAGHAAALIAITGYGQNEHVHRSTEAGFDRHLVKPVDFGVIAEICAQVGGAAGAEE
jgi:two-component system CheB/CheR fusion protein